MAKTFMGVMEARSRFEIDSHPRQEEHLSPVSVTSEECNDYEDELEVLWT
jgi:hypothetical protein